MTARKPKRIQRKRISGWKMPANTVSVSRPGKFGNPWKPERFSTVCATAKEAVDLFRKHELPKLRADAVKELRGKNLACWCPLHMPCHADLLLEVANA